MQRVSPVPQRPFRAGFEPYFAAHRVQRVQTKETRLDALITQMKAAARADTEETEDMLLDFERMRVGLRGRKEVWEPMSRYLPLAQAGRSALGRRTPSVQALMPRADSVMQKKSLWDASPLEESLKPV